MTDQQKDIDGTTSGQPQPGLYSRLKALAPLTFRWQAVLFLFPMIIIISAVYTFESVSTERRILRDEIINKGETIAVIAARNSELSLLSGNLEQLKISALSVMEIKDISFVCFLDNNSKVLLHEGKNFPLSAVPPVDPAKGTSFFEQAGFFEFFVPVVTVRASEGLFLLDESNSAPAVREQIGWVHIGLSKEVMKRTERQIMLRSSVLAGLFSLIGVILLYFFVSLVTRPLYALINAAKEVRHGEHPELAIMSPRSEIGRLSIEFNRMSCAIREREKQLHENVQELEVAQGELQDQTIVLENKVEELQQAQEALRDSEKQLRHSQKMEAIGALAGGVAHDFNNILNVILGYGTIIMDRLETGSSLKDHMNEVLIAADRAATLTKRLLAFSRKQGSEVRPVNINELILGLQKMLVRIIRENIEFTLDLADNPLFVLADAGQIEQVLINLTTNARDAMQDGGRMTISTETAEIDEEYIAASGYGKPGRYVLITFSDTGQGISEAAQKLIFEPFYTTKNMGEGTGLGLAISYGIIKQHNGYIKVYSEPGQGAAFRIYLPISEEALSQDRKAETEAVMGGNETILLAEDDASVMKLTRIVLESFGYRVISAEDGEDAISKFMENRDSINLVILDMIMPKKNGKEVGEAILSVCPESKILFASGYSMDNFKSGNPKLSEFDFIHKPVVPKDLLKKVREVLDR